MSTYHPDNGIIRLELRQEEGAECLYVFAGGFPIPLEILTKYPCRNEYIETEDVIGLLERLIEKDEMSETIFVDGSCVFENAVFGEFCHLNGIQVVSPFNTDVPADVDWNKLAEFVVANFGSPDVGVRS